MAWQDDVPFTYYPALDRVPYTRNGLTGLIDNYPDLVQYIPLALDFLGRSQDRQRSHEERMAQIHQEGTTTNNRITEFYQTLRELKASADLLIQIGASTNNPAMIEQATKVLLSIISRMGETQPN
jgi:hypothetical protein